MHKQIFEYTVSLKARFIQIIKKKVNILINIKNINNFFNYDFDLF